MLARKLVNSPESSFELSGDRETSTIRSATASISFEPRSPRSCTTILNPPAVPRPSTGGASKTLTRPSLISSCSLL